MLPVGKEPKHSWRTVEVQVLNQRHRDDIAIQIANRASATNELNAKSGSKPMQFGQREISWSC
jgi:hypothetical protein